MSKKLTFVFLFFAIKFSFAQNLTATQKIPDSVFAGNSFIVTTTIYRSPSIDFIELSQPLPKGFTAKSIDSKGGNFEFDKNEVKIIWLTPPKEETFTFSYLVKVPVNVFGRQTPSGKIIYITSNNDLKIFVLQAKKIMLLNSKTLVTLKPQKPTNPAPPESNHLTAKVVDNFLDENGRPVTSGFYVVVGTFVNKANADRFRASNYLRGHLNTKIIQNQYTRRYNTYVLKTNNKPDADVERMKYKMEYPDVWILKLD